MCSLVSIMTPGYDFFGLSFTDLTSYTPPLIRSFPCKVLSYYPERRSSNSFDETAITTVSIDYLILLLLTGQNRLTPKPSPAVFILA